MRTIVAPDQLAELDECFDQRRASNGDLYDYEIGGVHYMVPAPGGEHAVQQIRLGAALLPLATARGWIVAGPTNLGRLGQNDRNYIVPDIVVAERVTGNAMLEALVAIELLSPTEDEGAKVAAYRAVVAATGLKLRELWYVDPSERSLTVRDSGFDTVEHSDVFGFAVDELRALLGI